MSSTKIALSAVAALVLQLLVVRYLRFRTVNLDYLDVVLIVTVYCGFGRDPLRAMLVGAASGLVQDSFSGAILGTQSLTKTLIGFLVGSLSIRVALDKLVPRLVIMAVASTADVLLFVGLHRLFGLRLVARPIWDHLARHLGWHLTANLAAASLIFPVLDHLMRERPRRWGRRSGQTRLRKFE